MAGSTFNPHDLVPNSSRPQRAPRIRGSPAANAQDGGSIDNNHILYNLTGYHAPYLQNFEELPSGASLSPSLPLLQHDNYLQTLLNEDQERAIEALAGVPGDVVAQRLALLRSDHESRSMCSSDGLATVPESLHFPFSNSTPRRALTMEMPLPPRRQLSQRSGQLRLQESWKRGPHQHRPSQASSSSTNSSRSYEPTIFSQDSFETLTENSSRYPSGNFSSQAPIPAAKLLDPANEPFGDDSSGNRVTSGYHEAPATTVTANDSNQDHPSPPASSRTSSGTVKFSCTLCDSKATFRGKSKWKRHELSHMPSVEYICLPGGLIEDNFKCAICSVENPGYQHMFEHSAHLCLAKAIEARTWVRKDKFVKHIAGHGLSSNSLQVTKWTRKLPNRLSGCGFCIRGFDDFNERSLHVAKHFESGCDRANWDRSKVILGLLSQPRTTLSWQSLLGERFGGQPAPAISWSEDLAPGIQKRLEEAQDSGPNLAQAAFQSSSLCQMVSDDQTNNYYQSVLSNPGPSKDTVYPAEHLLGTEFDTFMPEASQSWFDDSEPTSDFPGDWGLP